MKKKIFILLAVVISVLGWSEIKAQMDTVWSYPIPENYKVATWSFSPNDSLIAISMQYDRSDTLGRDYTFLFRTLNGQKIREFRGIEGIERNMATIISPDNSKLITARCLDKGNANIVIWDLSMGDTLRCLKLDSMNDYKDIYSYYISNLQFTPDGRHLFANIIIYDIGGTRLTNYNHFVFWDTTNWQIAKQWKSYYKPNDMLISPRGNCYTFYYGASDSGNCLKINSLDSADTLIKNLYIGQKKAYHLCFSNDGKFLAVGCNKDTVVIWDNDSLKIYQYLNILDNVDIGFTKDSSYLVTKSVDGPTLIWDIRNKNLIYNYKDTIISNAWMTVSNNGYFIFLKDDKTNKFYLYNTHFSPNPVVERGDNHELSIIYPNPSEKVKKLKFNSAEMSIISIQLIDSEGNTVKDLGEKIFEQGENDINLDCSGLNSGIYFCRMTGKNLNKTYKIVIAR